ncbi:discoidin-2-like [Argopecten irradians]|uniref:discoidin-2-like n=1 Tax=Argopecten irradians TaxID=31199 RepID=UPI003714EFCE
MKTVLQLFGLISQANMCFGCGPCDYDLVTGPNGVPDTALSASSTHHSCPIEKVRISSSQGWCPAQTGDGHYIQVEFQTTSNLKAIQTLGRGDYNQWVSSYGVNISMDGITWSSILSNGSVKVFPANNDRHTIVTNTLAGNVVAKFIRIISITGNSYRSMRLEVQGCQVTNISNTCNKWKATRGSTGDFFPIVEETNAANHGLCGLMCYRQPDCDSFVFDVSSNHCRLLKSTPDTSYATVDLENVWYFMKHDN